MANYVDVGGLAVAEELHRFVVEEAIPGTGLTPGRVWLGAGRVINSFAPRNTELLRRRATLQGQLDDYHRKHMGDVVDQAEYERFLVEIGYLETEPPDFEISTEGVDDEIARLAGAQLVVPLLNARFAVNAANARWGSLYDALYGSDAISTEDGRDPGSAYNPARGAVVIAKVRDLLDRYLPLAHGSHARVTSYLVDGSELVVTFDEGRSGLAKPAQLVGFTGPQEAPQSLLLVHNGLHIEIQIDRADPVGSTDPAGVKDVVVEAALSTIMDLEDSVAAVDAADKVLGYRNWLRLMQGTLAPEVTKDGRTFVRNLRPDRQFRSPSGDDVVLPGRSLLMIRHVGMHMTTTAVLDAAGAEAPEGIVDGLVAGLCSLHDIRGSSAGMNSRTGSMYVVKPKLHGPAEVAFTRELFAEIEQVLEVAPNTIKIGIMDEERRTSANLKASIYEARERLAFINTGFLDRTGDEIRTSTCAGPMVRKAQMRRQTWIHAYEAANVGIGLACGLPGRAQIGKGMWAAPDNMADMMVQKVEHPSAGASCAWVPSPTAATLHALHYHEVNVQVRQQDLSRRQFPPLSSLLAVPVGVPDAWSREERLAELDNNVQSVLGYVVRWIDEGVGCSKVADLHGTALMEDRATLRISSQHVGNWLMHRVVSIEDVEASLRRMAVLVDAQNASDGNYVPMAPSFDGDAFSAARALLLEAHQQPNGYTEPVLHQYRLRRKAKAGAVRP